MSDKQSNESSSSEGVQPYLRDGGRASVHSGEEEQDLLRTISEYNDETVTSGEARENERAREEDLEKGIRPPGPPPKYSLFSKENRGVRMQVFKQYAVVILALWIFILSVWPIYWGSMYKRDGRLINLHFLVAVEEDRAAPISQALYLATQHPELQLSATWDFESNLSEADVQKLIHDQKYWAAIYVTESNVSQSLTNAFVSAENIDTRNFVRSLYETARDPTTMEGFVSPTVFKFEAYFQDALQTEIYPALIKNLTSEQFSRLQNTNVLTSYPIIQPTDAIPVEPVTNGPLQVGLIYIIIITFFEVMWMAQLYGTVAKSAITIHYIMFRVVLSQLNYLLISLAFTCLNAAFQIKMDNSWKGGFGVFWMVSYLTMAAVGGANQNIGLILFAIHPPLMGFWMLFFVMINISATFAPIPLCPEFYRFTYAMPIKNAYELLKVTLFDTSRKNLGRYFGILVAWIVLNNLLLPVCMAFFSWNMKRKIMKEVKSKNDAKKN
ncbi:hypothetical protein PMKS-000393 [Pichia membranifaciens]|uniref:DUF3533 domain-containing protein n=1 Tax=Pichia membranifaciens TaxID=4926 RepID=A0A1Q2YBL7_9ASCO|nr:hypothetical protein PMKS-000393 [Pichia membranifaciens]